MNLNLHHLIVISLAYCTYVEYSLCPRFRSMRLSLSLDETTRNTFFTKHTFNNCEWKACCTECACSVLVEIGKYISLEESWITVYRLLVQ